MNSLRQDVDPSPSHRVSVAKRHEVEELEKITSRFLNAGTVRLSKQRIYQLAPLVYNMQGRRSSAKMSHVSSRTDGFQAGSESGEACLQLESIFALFLV